MKMIDTLNVILTGIFIPLLPVITAYLSVYLRKKANEIEGRINNENINKYIGITENIIETCVSAVSQTYVDTLKKNGIFDKAAQAEAFEMCKQKVLSILNDSIKTVLNSAYGDLNTLVDAKIEYYVQENKQRKSIVG